MTSTTTTALIETLRPIFATFGIPRLLVTDNSTAFTSREMAVFCQKNGIRHITSAPFHPATNGQAERMVAETKFALRKLTKGSIVCRLARFLFRQHTTPHTTTGRSPAELMFGRQLKTALHAIHPTSNNSGIHEQPPKDAKVYTVNQRVIMRNFQGKPHWVQAVVLRRVGPRSYLLRTKDGKLRRRHIDHLRDFEDVPTQCSAAEMTAAHTIPPPAASVSPTTNEPTAEHHRQTADRIAEPTGRVRTNRQSKLPTRFRDFVLY
ncbi:uncharacterized protein K02A2.6-like [Ornithodoros turicata]